MPKPIDIHPLLILTGMSGAGKSTALGVLEDLGFETIDNIPLRFVETLAESEQGTRNLALGLDCRTRDFDATKLMATVEACEALTGTRPELIFLDCEDEEILKRFAVTRRAHPLALDRDVQDGIKEERRLLKPVRDMAEMLIDTTSQSIHDLRRMIETRLDTGTEDRLVLSLQSFSYRRGLPRHADLVFDVRFLQNPHYEAAMRDLTGQDQAVADFIMADPTYAPFIKQLQGLIDTLLPRYNHEGKHYLTIAVGCTGGQHRSVFVAEQLKRYFEAAGYAPLVTHRELKA